MQTSGLAIVIAFTSLSACGLAHAPEQTDGTSDEQVRLCAITDAYDCICHGDQDTVFNEYALTQHPTYRLWLKSNPDKDLVERLLTAGDTLCVDSSEASQLLFMTGEPRATQKEFELAATVCTKDIPNFTLTLDTAPAPRCIPTQHCT